MKKFIETLRSARWAERFLVAAALAILLLAQGKDREPPLQGQTAQEARLSSALSRIEGAGRVEAIISDGGVLILAENAYDLRLCLQMEYAVQTLLGTEVSRIEILPCEH